MTKKVIFEAWVTAIVFFLNNNKKWGYLNQFRTKMNTFLSLLFIFKPWIHFFNKKKWVYLNHCRNRNGDYAVLLDNKHGQTKFDSGYVHNGLLNAARRVIDAECEFWRGLVERNLDYNLTMARHSLGDRVGGCVGVDCGSDSGRVGEHWEK